MKSPHHSIHALILCLLVGVTDETAFGQLSLGNALSFNGTNQCVTITNFGSIIPTNENLGGMRPSSSL